MMLRLTGHGEFWSAWRMRSALRGPPFHGRGLVGNIDLVLHRGRIVSENYFNNMQPDTPHLSQSVAKSLVGSLTGILQQQGLVDPEAPLANYVPELKRCGYKDAKLKHALNMTSGVRFVEDYNTPGSDMTRIDIASGCAAAA